MDCSMPRPPCPLPTPRACSNSCPSSRWCLPTISSSVVPFSCPHFLPASGSFPMSQVFSWGGQSIGVSALASVLPVNTQDWSPLGWTGWISLQSKGLLRVFVNTTVQKHQFFSTQFFFKVQLSHPYMTTGKTTALTRHDLCLNHLCISNVYIGLGSERALNRKFSVFFCLFVFKSDIERK